VIFITGRSTWDRIAEAIERGAADYLLKPVDCHQLTSVISQECERLTRWSLALRESLHRSVGPSSHHRATI
jgi:DNA-binding NtrC family response regulator